MKPYSLEAGLSRPMLAVHDYSCKISKLKPKIRIIHIVEPQIIKTTVEDFQELVQRLTGNCKQVERKQSRRNKGNNALQQKPCTSRAEAESAPLLHGAQRMKIEVEELYGAGDQTLFSSFLEDVDGFLHDMNEFPQFSFRPSQFNIFGVGEMPYCS